MEDPNLEFSLKTRFNTNYCDIFLQLHKNVDKFWLCLKIDASIFPLTVCIDIREYIDCLLTQPTGLVLVE
jgi:hypothetical protein